MDKTLKSKSQKDDDNENENENDKTLMSSNEDNQNENDNDNENEDDETMSQNEKNEIIKDLNDLLDEIIDKSKSFEEQIKSIKKIGRSKRASALLRFW